MKSNKLSFFKIFTMAFGVSFIIFSLVMAPVAFKISPLLERDFSVGSSDTNNSEPISSSSQKPQSLNILSVEDLNGSMECATLIRIDTSSNTIKVSSIPIDTQTTLNKNLSTIKDEYQNLGIKQCVLAIEDLLAISIDRYAVYEKYDFIKIIDMIGALDYNIPYNLIYKNEVSNTFINIPKGRHSLNGSSFYDLIHFPNFKEGYLHKYSLQSDSFASFINQKMTKWQLEHSSYLFEKTINLINTNLSINDYNNYIPMLKKMQSLSPTPAIPVYVTGVFKEKFIISDNSKAEMNSYYSNN